MIAISGETRRTLLAKGGAVTYTATETTYTDSDYSSTALSGTYVVVVADDGWCEVTVNDIAVIKIKESAKQQDEPEPAKPTTFFPRRYVNRKSEPRRRPRQLASGYG